jgi:hypothetical protein
MTQFDIAGISTDQDLLDLDSIDANEGTGEEFRRARLSVDGELGENLIFKAEYDFAQGDADFADVWVGLQRLPYAGRALAGHFKEPMSLEITSDRFITFMERALPVLAFARAQLGHRRSTPPEQRMTWGVGGTATQQLRRRLLGVVPYDVTARITGLRSGRTTAARSCTPATATATASRRRRSTSTRIECTSPIR